MLENPENAWGYRALGECYAELGMALYKLGHKQEALLVYQQAMQILPQAGDIDYDVLLLCLNGSAAVLGEDKNRSAAQS